MKRNNIFSVLVLFLELTILIIPVCLLLFPSITDKESKSIILDNEPKSSQISLKIIVSDQQAPTIIGVIDDFLADSLGSGVNSVEVVASGTRADDQHTFLVEQMILESTEFDVIGLDTIWLAQFAENDWISVLDSLLNLGELDDYVDSMVDSCKYKGITYAYPYFMNLGILYYRKDIIEDNGFNEADFDTWLELNTTANFILNNVSGQLKDPNLVGYVGQFDVYEGGVVNFFEWASSYGATNLVTSEGDININNPKVEEAMTFLQALFPPQFTGVQGTPYIIPRVGLVMDEGSSVSKWLANESIFMRQWTFAYMNSVNINMSFGVVPLPTASGAIGEKSSCVGGTVLAIPNCSQNQEAAWNLTRFLGDQLAQEYELTNASNFPALKSVYNFPPPGFEWIKNWTSQFQKTMARPVHPKYPLISSIIADSFSDILKQIKDVNVTLAEMEAAILKITSDEVEVPPSEPKGRIAGYNIMLLLLLCVLVISLITVVYKKNRDIN